TVAPGMEPGEEGGDRGHRPRGLRHRVLEDEPAAGEAVHHGARARRRAVAAEVVRAQRVDQHDEDARRPGARSLPRAPALADEADVRPAGRADERAGPGGLGRERDLDVALGPRGQVHALVAPAPVVTLRGRVGRASRDVAAVGADRLTSIGASIYT